MDPKRKIYLRFGPNVPLLFFCGVGFFFFKLKWATFWNPFWSLNFLSCFKSLHEESHEMGQWNFSYPPPAPPHRTPQTLLIFWVLVLKEFVLCALSFCPFQ
jgi:hypothetical protein